MLPVGKPKNRPRVRNMAKRPEAFVGETVVIAFLFLFCKPDSTQGVPRFLGRNPQAVMRIDRLAVSIAAAVSHPRSVARTYDGLQSADKSAGRNYGLHRLTLADVTV